MSKANKNRSNEEEKRIEAQVAIAERKRERA